MLATERLILRSWEAKDLAPMVAICQDPRVMEYFPSLPDKESIQQLIEKANAHLNEHGTTLYAAECKDTGALIGFIGIWLADRFEAHFTPAYEIGWRLGHEHWGQGLATEGAKKTMEHAFHTLELPELVSFTSKINQRSIRVMEKIGLQHNPTDDFDHPEIEANSPLKAHVLYRLTREQTFFQNDSANKTLPS